MLTQHEMIAMRQLLTRLLRRSLTAAERTQAQKLLAKCPHGDAVGLALRSLVE